MFFYCIFCVNFQPLEAVSRYRDPQHQVVENQGVMVYFHLDITPLARLPRYLGVEKCPAVAGPEIYRGRVFFLNIFVCKINVIRQS